jgi:hypothetical protein
MANDVPPRGQSAKPSRKTLRLTFRTVDGQVQLVRTERLDMITPPSIGETPEAGKSSGFWMELRDAGGKVLSHRVLNAPLRDSVEVHAPDGTIKRVTGPASDRTFEVLLPDQGDASTVVLMGHDPKVPADATLRAGVDSGSGELARFGIPK